MGHNLARRGCLTQASTAQKPITNRNTPLSTVKYLTMKTSNSAGDRTLTSQDDELDIPVVVYVVKASETGKHSPNMPLRLPVDIFTTAESFCWC